MSNLKKSKKGISLSTGFKTWGVIPLLFFYILSSQIQNIHKILHSEHQQRILHSSPQEEDPCHRSLFHQEENACKHKAHITNSENCSLCEFAGYKEQWFASNNVVNTIYHEPVGNNSVIEFLITDLSIHLCSRAPPVF